MGKRSILILMLLVGAMGITVAQNHKKATSEWKYEVPQAPYGYEKGTFSLTKDKDSVSGELQLNSGYKIKMEEVSLKNDTLKAGVYVDSEYVRVLARVKDNKMSGTVDTSMGVLEMKAEKVAKDTK